MGKLPIRPIIVAESHPLEVEKNRMVNISCRMFDKKKLTLMEVSRIYMEITSMKDGHNVWPLEVVRKDASGFDIGIGTQEMKENHEYLVRISNNYNLSPSASTKFRITSTTIPILPILIPLGLSTLFMKKYSRKGIQDVDGLVSYLKGQGFPDDKVNEEVKRILKELDDLPSDKKEELRIPIDTYRDDPIKKMFITQMDHRVCPLCKEHEFKVYDYDDPTSPFIPVHPRCRCTYDLKYATDTREAAFVNAAQASIIYETVKRPVAAVKVIMNKYY